jgi:hypothetical protein
MALSAETAIRDWINTRAGLTGEGNPLPRGAFLNGRQPRSPAHGAYALLIREAGAGGQVIAEDSDPSLARITAHVYAGTIEAAEAACSAVANAFQSLTGCPQRCGSTGVTVLVADNHTDPGYVPMPGAGGEQHCFTTSSTFMLTRS